MIPIESLLICKLALEYFKSMSHNDSFGSGVGGGMNLVWSRLRPFHQDEAARGTGPTLKYYLERNQQLQQQHQQQQQLKQRQQQLLQQQQQQAMAQPQPVSSGPNQGQTRNPDSKYHKIILKIFSDSACRNNFKGGDNS